mmetsp:Transcript_19570/g.42083  ORF Transcript_19570/g.42083 Transcript_19570/m.42083 type:complete len:325 (-) Transcript_19570:7-981(-)
MEVLRPFHSLKFIPFHLLCHYHVVQLLQSPEKALLDCVVRFDLQDVSVKDLLDGDDLGITLITLSQSQRSRAKISLQRHVKSIGEDITTLSFPSRLQGDLCHHAPQDLVMHHRRYSVHCPVRLRTADSTDHATDQRWHVPGKGKCQGCQNSSSSENHGHHLVTHLERQIFLTRSQVDLYRLVCGVLAGSLALSNFSLQSLDVISIVSFLGSRQLISQLLLLKFSLALLGCTSLRQLQLLDLPLERRCCLKVFLLGRLLHLLAQRLQLFFRFGRPAKIPRCDTPCSRSACQQLSSTRRERQWRHPPLHSRPQHPPPHGNEHTNLT